MQLQLAQVLSALSRTPVCLGPSLLRAARRRVLTLLAAGGFEQLFEVAMVLNAAVKLRVSTSSPKGCVYADTANTCLDLPLLLGGR